MEKIDIEKTKLRVGKILHTYRIKFGHERFERLLERLSWSLVDEFDRQTTIFGLRTIEAEYAASIESGQKLEVFENKKDTE